MVHYNAQSIVNKVDILGAELRNFDILAFSEFWDMVKPICIKWRTSNWLTENQNGRTVKVTVRTIVMIYTKGSIYYKRRLDLEPNRI